MIAKSDVNIENNLINNPRMFNLGIDDLDEKPYILQKNLLLQGDQYVLVRWVWHLNQ